MNALGRGGVECFERPSAVTTPIRRRRRVVVGTLCVLAAVVAGCAGADGERDPGRVTPSTDGAQAADGPQATDGAQAAPATDPPVVPVTRRLLGFYPGYADAATLDAMEQQLGGALDVVVQFGGEREPADFVGSVRGEMQGLADWISRRDPIFSLTIPLAFGDASARTPEGVQVITQDLQDTAAGAHDEEYTIVAELLVEAGLDDAVLRLGHEFDGDWYPWSAHASCEGYIDAFRHVADVVRAVSPDFRIEWTGTVRYFDDWSDCAYPGGEYVDIIGLDVYDRGGPMIAFSETEGAWVDPVAVWSEQFRPHLESHLAFAIAHGKPVSYPEWGVVSSAESGAFGGDNPTFIRSMAAWLRSLPTAGPGTLIYHSYFLGGAPEYDFRPLERSSAAFFDEFGSQED